MAPTNELATKVTGLLNENAVSKIRVPPGGLHIRARASTAWPPLFWQGHIAVVANPQLKEDASTTRRRTFFH